MGHLNAHAPGDKAPWIRRKIEIPPLPPEVEAVLARVKAALPGFELREGQHQMMRAIAHRLQNPGEKARLLVEAPPGSGKSFAALIPALALRRHIVYCTANLGLQDQLAKKDLPFLQEALAGLPIPNTGRGRTPDGRSTFDWRLLKGYSNYVCLNELESNRSRIEARDWPERSADPVAWALDEDNLTGDRSDFPDPRGAPEALWRLMSIGAPRCLHRECPHHPAVLAEIVNSGTPECFIHGKRTLDYDVNGNPLYPKVVVTNHYLYSLAMAGARVSLLHSPHVVIVDEAHTYADIARKMWGWSFGIGRFDLHRFYERRHEQLYEQMRPYLKALKNAARMRLSKERLEKLPPGRLSGALPDILGPLHKRVKEIEKVHEEIATQLRADLYDELTEDALNYLVPKKIKLPLRQQLRASIRADPSETVTFVEEEGSRLVLTTHQTLLTTSDDLEEGDDRTAKPVSFDAALRPTAVLMSATLTVAKGFGALRKDLGIGHDPNTWEISVPSPFDFTKVGFIVPSSVYDLGTKAKGKEHFFKEACSQAVAEVIAATGGRVLALFGSYARLHHAFEACAPIADALGIQLLRQGVAPKMMLIKAFKEDETSCLFGVESFWTGVDVPGDALRVVVMDRIPFPHFDDPLMQALGACGKKFGQTSLPRAVRAFRQGFGRLVRSKKDRGVVVFLDRRVITKRYGRDFIASLPDGVWRSENLGDVARAVEDLKEHP